MEVFMGTIMAVGFSYAPRGWMFCNGQQLAIAQNSALFSLLGTTYGGNGQTTFALPDLRGRVVVGSQQQGPGLQPVQQGEIAGTNNVTILANGSVSVTLTAANMPAHTHPGAGLTAATAIHVGTTGGTTNTPTPAADSYLVASAGGPGGAAIYTPTAPTPIVALNAAVSTTTVSGTTGSTGTGTPLVAPVTTQALTSIMQPYTGLNYIIAVEGIFPSRN